MSSLCASAWACSRKRRALANREEKAAGLTATRATLQEPAETDAAAVPTRSFAERPPGLRGPRVGTRAHARPWRRWAHPCTHPEGGAPAELTPDLERFAFGCRDELGFLVGSAVQMGPVGRTQGGVKAQLRGSQRSPRQADSAPRTHPAGGRSPLPAAPRPSQTQGSNRPLGALCAALPEAGAPASPQTLGSAPLEQRTSDQGHALAGAGTVPSPLPGSYGPAWPSWQRDGPPTSQRAAATGLCLSLGLAAPALCPQGP